jgi:hypothetical protein
MDRRSAARAVLAEFAHTARRGVVTRPNDGFHVGTRILSISANTTPHIDASDYSAKYRSGNSGDDVRCSPNPTSPPRCLIRKPGTPITTD